MKIKNIFLTLLLFCLLFSVVRAAETDFVGSSANSVINVCSCATFEDTIYVKNTGQKISFYNLNNDLGWITIYPNWFILNPGEIKEVKSFITPKCGTSGGFESKTNIIADGVKKSLEQRIIVQKCPNVALSTQDTYEENCPCQTLTYSFTVENTGTYLETYSFSIDQLGEYATFSENPVVLNKGEKKQIFVYLNPPCDLFGDFEPTLIVNTQNSGFISKVKLAAKINPCYGFNVQLGESVYACEISKNEIPVQIENTANIPNEYKLSLEGPSWVTLPGDIVILYPGQAVQLNITAIPPLNSNATYNVTLKVLTNKGHLEGKKSFLLTVDNCYDFDLILPVQKDDVACGGMNVYDVVIRNNAKLNQSYDIYATSTATIADSASLKPGKETKLELTIFSDCENMTQKQHVDVKVINNFDLAKTAGIDLDVSSREEFYKTRIWPNKAKINYNDKVIELKIRNEGKKQSTFAVYSGQIGLARIDPTSLNLDVNQEVRINVTLTSARVPEGIYSLPVFVKSGDYVKETKLEIKLRDTIPNKIKYTLLDWKNDILNAYYGYVRPYLYYIVIALMALIIWILILLILLVIRKRKIRRLHQELVFGKKSEKAINDFDKVLSQKSWKTISQPTAVFLENKEINITKITIYPKKTLRNVSLEIEKPEFEPDAALSLEETYNQIVNIRRKNINDEYIEKVLVVFRVEKKWLRKNRVNKKHVVLKRYRNNKWKPFNARLIGKDTKYFYYESEINGFSYFAITKGIPKEEPKVITAKVEKKEASKILKEKRPEKKEEPKVVMRYTPRRKKKVKMPWFWIIILLLFLIITAIYVERKNIQPYVSSLFPQNYTLFGNKTKPPVVVVGPNATTPGNVTPINVTPTNITVVPIDLNQQEIDKSLKFISDNNLQNSRFYLVWKKNTNLLVNLSGYLYDPDLDPLTFHATNPINVTILINGDMATIIPDKDFYGVRTVNFAATDATGAIGYTKDVTLIVLNQAPGITDVAYTKTKDFLWKAKMRAEPYRLYLLAFVILVLIVFLLVKYNQNIVDFFEEEEKPKRRRK